jgi:hypothetical protein
LKYVPIGFGLKNFFNQQLAISLATVIDTLFNNITGKLVFAQLEYLATNFGDNHGLVSLTTTFKNMLDDIVAILILDKLGCATM